MFEALIGFFTNVISTAGYAGVFFLMTLESMVVPVPSEAVMPFAGVLWFEGKMSLAPIIFWSTLGSIAGSLISYYVGLYGGRPLVEKYGKYVLLSTRDLTFVENFFAQYGDKAIFISRFIPVVRHLISIPAGAGEMKIPKFILYTALGAGMWNAFLAGAGYYLGSNWMEIRKYSEVIDVFLIAALVGLGCFYVYKRRKRITRDVLDIQDEI